MSDTNERPDVEIIYRRLDQQDAVLLQLHDMIRDHIAENRHIEGQIKELVEMYRGSKVHDFRVQVPDSRLSLPSPLESFGCASICGSDGHKKPPVGRWLN